MNTVVIATYNEAQTIGALLAALCGLDGHGTPGGRFRLGLLADGL